MLIHNYSYSKLSSESNFESESEFALIRLLKWDPLTFDAHI